MCNKIMTTNNRIRDEKLPYDVNRKAAKVSALYTGKIDKYEYLTGKQILPSNIQQIIEQIKFTYSPLGKGFGRQIKTTQDQRERGGDILKDLKGYNKQLANDYEDKLLISNDREIFKNIYNKRLDKIEELTEKIGDNNLVFITISAGRKTDFSK